MANAQSTSSKSSTKTTATKPKKKAAPKKATDSQVVKYLSALQRTDISADDRSAVTQVIRLIS